MAIIIYTLLVYRWSIILFLVKRITYLSNPLKNNGSDVKQKVHLFLNFEERYCIYLTFNNVIKTDESICP